jgi:hypothetical protein
VRKQRELKVAKVMADRRRYRIRVSEMNEAALDAAIVEQTRLKDEATARLAELWEERAYRVEYTGLAPADKTPALNGMETAK